MLLTFVSFDGTTANAPLDVALAPASSTSTVTSVTHTPPLSFQTFTCNVCHPLGAPTGPSILCAFQDDVEELLSSEYPTAVTGFEEHELALISRVKGEETCSLLVGFEMVVCANADNEEISIKVKGEKIL